MTEADRRWDRNRQPRSDLRQPALLVLDHRSAQGTPRQPDGEVFAEPEHGVVPAFANLDQTQVCEVGMLFAKKSLDEERVDRDFSGRTANHESAFEVGIPV
jgi:hypothetical protein